MTETTFNIQEHLNPPPVLVRQPLQWYHRLLHSTPSKKEHAVQPMGLYAWQLWKELQKPQNKDDFTLLRKLLSLVCPTLSEGELRILTIAEASLIIVTAMGGIQEVLEIMGKGQASTPVTPIK